MSPILKENVLKAAIRRRELELEMLQMKKDMKGDRLIEMVKRDWLESITLENRHVDILIEELDQKPEVHVPQIRKNFTISKEQIIKEPLKIKDSLKDCSIPSEDKRE
jgi:hypothetical protein